MPTIVKEQGIGRNLLEYEERVANLKESYELLQEVFRLLDERLLLLESVVIVSGSFDEHVEIEEAETTKKLVEELHDARTPEVAADSETLRRHILHESWCGHIAWEQAIENARAIGLSVDDFEAEMKKLNKAKAAKEKAREEEMYTEYVSIEQALASKDTALVKGSWLHSKSQIDSFILARRQEIECSAFWIMDDLMPKVLLFEKPGWVQIVAISYCWFTGEHPDPQGEQVRILGKVLGLPRLDIGIGVQEHAIFFDFCSMYQKERSPAEDRAFKRSLKSVNLWYGHSCTAVWILSKQSLDYPSSLPYDQRGWPTFELHVSALLTDRKCLIDLGKLDCMCDTWDRVAVSAGGNSPGICAAKRPAPCLPKDFVRLLEKTAFTNGADRHFVAGKYAQTFEEVLVAVRTLNFNHLGWGDEEVLQLSSVLPHYHQLTRLWLKDNFFQDAGVIALAEVIPLCQALERLDIKNCKATVVGKSALIDAWAAAGKPKDRLLL